MFFLLVTFEMGLIYKHLKPQPFTSRENCFYVRIQTTRACIDVGSIMGHDLNEFKFSRRSSLGRRWPRVASTYLSCVADNNPPKVSQCARACDGWSAVRTTNHLGYGRTDNLQLATESAL